MCADMYSIALALNTSPLLQGVTQVHTSMHQLAQTEARRTARGGAVYAGQDAYGG
jgi:hypothetical protein